MRSIIRNSRTLKAVLPIACLLVSASAWCQVAPLSGDASFSLGYNHVGKGNNFNDTTTNGFTTGGTGGVNVTRYIAVGGEFNFFSMPKVSGVSEHMLNYGAAARFNLIPAGRVVPYGVFGVGGARFTASESGQSASLNGNYVGGGGLSYYVGPSWGVRAELRDNRFGGFKLDGITASTNVVTMTGGIFYQFGGTFKRPAKK